MKKSVSIVAFVIVFGARCVFSDSSLNFSQDEKYFGDEYQKTNAQSHHYQPHTLIKKYIPKSTEKTSIKSNHGWSLANFGINLRHGVNQLKRQDAFSDGGLSLLAVALAAFAAGAATYSIIQNSNQATDFESQESRLSSVCSAAQGVGNTVLTLSKEDDFSGGDAGVSATNAEIRARLNLIENAINNFVTPTCS